MIYAKGVTFMQTSKWLFSVCVLLLVIASTRQFAQATPGKRYMNIQQVSHLSDGWVAYSNGDLYKCHYADMTDNRPPTCVLATGLPASMHSVSALWGAGDRAWVTYTDGEVYGCRYHGASLNEAPYCLPAQGLP